MTTITLPDLPIDAIATRTLISPFTLRVIGARDLMVDDTGTLSFFYGHGQQVKRMEIRRTALDGYTIDVGHIDPRTRVWVVDNQQHHVHPDDLRAAIRELT